MSRLGLTQYGEKAHILPKEWRPAFGWAAALCGAECWGLDHRPKPVICTRCKDRAAKMEPK